MDPVTCTCWSPTAPDHNDVCQACLRPVWERLVARLFVVHPGLRPARIRMAAVDNREVW